MSHPPPSVSLYRLLLWGAVVLVLLVTSGCFSLRNHDFTVEVRVPVEQDAVAPGQVERNIPWSNRTLRANARVELPVLDGEMNPETDLPLRAGITNLRARDAARADLAAQLARLPAAQPPPGELNDRNIETFAANRPRLAEAILEQIRSAEPTSRKVADNQLLVELTLPLGPLADAVLAHGGGFNNDTEIGNRFGPRQRGAAAAERQASRELLRQLLEHRATDDVTIGEWVRWDSTNPIQLEEALASIKVVKSRSSHEVVEGEPAPRLDLPEEWIYEIKFEAKPLVDLIKKEYREREAALKRARQDLQRANNQ